MKATLRSGKTTSSHPLHATVNPPLSYIALITLAIKNSPLQMATLNDVYQYIITNFPYFQENRQKWQNTVRHNLSLNDCFIKIPRRLLGIPGKGNFWALHPAAGGMFNHGSLLRRRRRFRTKMLRLENDTASIHHIDSGHHFDLYGAQNPSTMSTRVDLTCPREKTHHRSMVPGPQYSMTPLNYHPHDCNFLPYRSQMSFDNFWDNSVVKSSFGPALCN